MSTERRRLVYGTLAAVLIATLALGLVVAVLRTWTLADQIADTQKRSRATLVRLTDCTELGGDCYEAAQARSRSAVNELNTLGLLRVACADRRGTQTPEEIQGCIDRTLEHYRR